MYLCLYLMGVQEAAARGALEQELAKQKELEAVALAVSLPSLG